MKLCIILSTCLAALATGSPIARPASEMPLLPTGKIIFIKS